jgi:hypothetical protein
MAGYTNVATNNYYRPVDGQHQSRMYSWLQGCLLANAFKGVGQQPAAAPRAVGDDGPATVAGGSWCLQARNLTDDNPKHLLPATNLMRNSTLNTGWSLQKGGEWLDVRSSSLLAPRPTLTGWCLS